MLSYTVIIPAATNNICPLLQKASGTTILENFVATFDSAERIVFVVSPKHSVAVEEAIKVSTTTPKSVFNVEQLQRLGTYDAVKFGLDWVGTQYTVVCYGTQQILDTTLIQRCLEMLQSCAAEAVVPIICVDKPSTFLDIDVTIKRVLHEKEDDDLPMSGFTDASLFVFETVALRKLMSEINPAFMKGKRTGDYNFTSLLPFVSKQELISIDKNDVISVDSRKHNFRIASRRYEIGIHGGYEGERVGP